MTKDAEPTIPLLTYDEQVKRKGELRLEELVMGLRDGRAVVRANAALGLAALGYAGRDLVPFLRDGDPMVARAAAEALAHLGRVQKDNLVPIVGALDEARPEVVAIIERMLSELVGVCDAELVSLLDTAQLGAPRVVVAAGERVGLRALHVLQGATRDERALVRLNAVGGVGKLAALEPVSAIAAMHAVALEDDVSDVRAAGRAALAGFMARARAEAVARAGAPVPSKVPALLQRALTADELEAAAKGARLDELLTALDDARSEIRLNGVRVLARQGADGADGAPALTVASRDADRTVRLESVRALAALARSASVAVAPALVRALGDRDGDVIAAAETALAELGAAAEAALLDGLESNDEAHGARVAALLGRLPDGPRQLRAALESTSVDVLVSAAHGLRALGPARAGAVVAALSAATRGGNARVRAAVNQALATIDPRPDRTPPPLAIDGFDAHALDEAALAKHKDVLAAAGVAGLAARLADARAVVRANTALALGVLGGDGAPEAIAVCLRDDDAAVRVSAARALTRLGEPAVAACAADVVRALRGADPAFASLLIAMIKGGTAQRAVGAALAGAFDASDWRHAHALAELLVARPDAVDLLCEAFERPGAQDHVARAFVMLGKDRLGKGRAVLERARVDVEARVRDLATATLLAIDGPRTAPAVPAIAGFETTILDKSTLAGARLDAGALLAVLDDGRAVVRCNAVTAIGTLGPAAAHGALAVGALLRDDDARVRLAAAHTLDQLGDDAVVAAAPQLVSALRGEPALAELCAAALAARKGKVESALVAGLAATDELHGMRVADLICALPDARDLLFAAFDGESQDVQINAGFGIGKLGAKRAGAEGRRRLERYLPGPPTRRKYAMQKALAMLGG